MCTSVLNFCLDFHNFHFLNAFNHSVVMTGHCAFFKSRLAPVRTNRPLKLYVYRSPIQLRTGLRLNTLDQLEICAN